MSDCRAFHRRCLAWLRRTLANALFRVAHAVRGWPDPAFEPARGDGGTALFLHDREWRTWATGPDGQWRCEEITGREMAERHRRNLIERYGPAWDVGPSSDGPRLVQVPPPPSRKGGTRS